MITISSLNFRNLPRANILAVMLVTIVYIFTNISYLTAMTAAEMLTVDAVAVVSSYHV